MSSRRTGTLQISPLARRDFIDILRYTGKTWGQHQLVVYRDKLDAALQSIAQNPQLGHRRDDLPSTHLAYLVGSHIIIYRTDTDPTAIVRILHQRMSLTQHL